MTTTEDVTNTIKRALRDNPAKDVLSVVLGNFVGLTLALTEQAGHDPDKAITINGAPGRDVTIHAATGQEGSPL